MLYGDNMSETLEGLAKDAIESALCSLRVLAEEAGLHQVTLARWRTRAAGVGPESARKLAAVIERRALEMLRLASQLRAQADLEHKGGSDE